MVKLVLEKAEEPEIKLPTSAGSSKKQEFQKNIYFCFIDYAKAFDCVDHNIMGYKDIQHWNKLYDDPLDLAGYYDPITGQYQEPSKVSQFFTNLGCHLLIGGEMAIGKNLFLRASYDYETHREMGVPEARSLVGFSAGFGIRIKAFQIDYARSRNNIVGSPNFLTLRVDLSKF